MPKISKAISIMCVMTGCNVLFLCVCVCNCRVSGSVTLVLDRSTTYKKNNIIFLAKWKTHRKDLLIISFSLACVFMRKDAFKGKTWNWYTKNVIFSHSRLPFATLFTNTIVCWLWLSCLFVCLLCVYYLEKQNYCDFAKRNK